MRTPPGEDEAWGTPIRPIEWLAAPVVMLLVGAAGIVDAAIRDLGVARWIVAGGAIIVIGASLVLYRSGFLAYSRMTVVDTARYLTARTVCAAISAAVVMTVGIFTGSQFWVMVGVLTVVALARLGSPAFSILGAPSRVGHLADCLVLVLWGFLFACSVSSGIIALADPYLSAPLSSAYLGGGIVYVVVAIVGGALSIRRIRKDIRGGA